MKTRKITAGILAGAMLLVLSACQTEVNITEYNGTSTQTNSTVTTQPLSDTTVTTLQTETASAGTTEITTSTPVPSQEATSAALHEATTNAVTDVNSKAQILAVLTQAINQTKGYKGSITVDHEESFDIIEPVVNVGSSATAGSLATKAVNFVKDLVLKPSQEVYNFSNGVATTSEKEQTQLLLPKAAAFSLPVEGVAEATMTQENGMTHIKMTLAAEETHSLSEVPAYHAASIGYLDLDGSFKIIKISKIDINYPGSTIDAYIRADGYVQSITYVINMHAYSEASGMGISGSAEFNGAQIEVWKINW